MLTDEERTIKKLDDLIAEADKMNDNFIYIRTSMAKIIIRLITEGGMKAEKPIPDRIRVFRCPECLTTVSEKQRYCRICGQEIKWP